MTTQAPPDVQLAPLGGEARPLVEWVTNFHLVLVVLDPYTNQSSWLLPTAGKILRAFAPADCRVAFAVTAKADDARRFLGPWATEILTFADPDRALVDAFELETLPAVVHVGTDLAVHSKVEGWEPLEWREAATELAKAMSWSVPSIPAPGDPGHFEGSPAKGE